MGFDLLNLEKTKVSRDLTGYITYIYGPAKVGKTTLASQAGTALVLAFERGYNALPGIYAQDVATWGEMRSLLRELKKPEVKEKFQAVVIDTVDIAASACEKYVCAQNNVERINQIPYGGGYTLLRREFEDVYRTIAQLGYALFFISHDKTKTFTRKDGTTYDQIVPSCPSTLNEIVKNMADIYAYAEKYEVDGKGSVRLVLRSPDNSADTGCRFRYIQPMCEMGYKPLCEALNKAIDKEAVDTDGKFVTDTRATVNLAPEYDYEGLIKEFGEIASQLMSTNPEYYQPRITQVVEKTLGKGHKVSEATIDQAELLSLIVDDMKDLASFVPA